MTVRRLRRSVKRRSEWLKVGNYAPPNFDTRFGKIRVIPGETWEPIYMAREIRGKVIDFAWFCPHCGHEYHNKKSCLLHCAGKQGMFVATCYKLPIHQCHPGCRCHNENLV